MAADLIMPTLAADQQQSRHFLPNNNNNNNNAHAYVSAAGYNHNHNLYSRPPHTRSRSYQIPLATQISPRNTSTMSPNYFCSTPPSPTAQHIQDCGRPMYIPAVLRRCDEFPVHQVIRCTTAGSTSSSDSDSTLKRANTILMSIPGLSMFSQHLAGRSRSPGDNTRTLDGDWKLDAFPQVTDLPTRKHWKLDSQSTVCDDPTCKRTFSYFTRRHHCRKCGNIFCDWHSSAALPLDQNANFNPRATPSRTCNYCFDEVKALHSRNNSQSSGSTSDVATPPTPVNAAPVPGGVTPPHRPEVAASVARDWNWSTF